MSVIKTDVSAHQVCVNTLVGADYLQFMFDCRALIYRVDTVLEVGCA